MTCFLCYRIIWLFAAAYRSGPGLELRPTDAPDPCEPPPMNHRARPYTLLEPQGPAVPLLVSIPHTGTAVPAAIAGRFVSEEAHALIDTDWHLHDLYAFARELGATILHATMSRYVVDLNRPRDAQPLYPGRTETGLVPTRTFGGKALYSQGDEPGPEEIAQRVREWWDPYHARLREELGRLRERFGFALLFDAHSITSFVPDFFEGELPALVLGDADGTSAASALVTSVRRVHTHSQFASSHNHPFRGGYITRAYGRPDQGIHAIQLEMAQRTYMCEEPPFAFDEERAQHLRPVLRKSLEAFIQAGLDSL